MSQLLNIVVDSKSVCLYRTCNGEANLIEEFEIQTTASFFLENLKELIRKNHEHPELLRIYFNPEKYTLIPSSLFLPSKLEDYFQINFGAKNSDEFIHYESILTLGTVLIFAIPTWLVSLKSEINAFGEIKTGLGRNLSLLNGHKSPNLIRCLISHGKMDVLVKSNGKLLLSNQYEVQNEEDVIYFLLLALQKLNLNESTILEVNCNSKAIDLNRFKTISESIQELNDTKIEFIENKSYFNSILCV